MALPALTMAALYKSRWQVEMFFKWITQHLRIKNFLGNSQNAFSRSAVNTDMDFLREFLAFLTARRKLWMAPIILLMVVLGGLLILVKGSVIAPFIYTLF